MGDRATCAACGHSARHGRRGYGQCRQLTITQRGAEELARLGEKYGQVQTLVLGALLSLPGMTEQGCDCKRMRYPRAAKRTLASLEAELARDFPEEGRRCDEALDKLLADMKAGAKEGCGGG